MSQYNNFHKLYECFEVKEKSVSKPDRGAQTTPLTLIEKDTIESNLSYSENIITNYIPAFFITDELGNSKALTIRFILKSARLCSSLSTPPI